MSLSPGKLKHMNALSNSAGVIAAAAMDQRGSLKKGIASAKGIPEDQVTAQMMEEYTRERPMRIKIPVSYDGIPPQSNGGNGNGSH